MTQFHSQLGGKRGLVVGIANADSVAYGCAAVLREAGALDGNTVFVDGGRHAMAGRTGVGRLGPEEGQNPTDRRRVARSGRDAEGKDQP